MMFSLRTPNCMYSRAQAIPAAPAPLMTMRMSSRRRPVSSAAFSRPAEEMMAVPCWSSWKTGMSMLRESSSSM